MISNPLEGVDVIYWINLDFSVERRNRMEELFKDSCFDLVTNIRIPAVDGKTFDFKILLGPETQISNNVEYAGFLSHLEAIRKFSESDFETAIIFEDDVSLDFKKYWRKPIKEIMAKAPQDWEILMISYISQSLPIFTYTRNSNATYVSSAAYILKRKTAKKLIDSIYKSGNYVLGENIRPVSDIYLYTKLKTYVYKYPYFIYRYNEISLLHQEHVATIHNISRRRIENMLEKRFKIFSIWDYLKKIKTYSTRSK